LLAAIAPLGWIAERLFKLHSSVDVIVNGVAHLAPYVAGGLFTVSLLCWLPRNGSKEKRAVERCPRNSSNVFKSRLGITHTLSQGASSTEAR
jgi:hypothetical protein